MKLFEIIAGVILIWFALRAVRQGSQPAGPIGKARRQAASRRSETALKATETVLCRSCGAYVPADHPTACERPDCPFAKIS
ncbi:MAG TPA: hypothetical protein VKZ79_02325 [Alphaproteobacteria bacterium]|nr:hypothetical protein [Alphaproteobacteria bacterium]